MAAVNLGVSKKPNSGPHTNLVLHAHNEVLDFSAWMRNSRKCPSHILNISRVYTSMTNLADTHQSPDRVTAAIEYALRPPYPGLPSSLMVKIAIAHRISRHDTMSVDSPGRKLVCVSCRRGSRTQDRRTHK